MSWQFLAWGDEDPLASQAVGALTYVGSANEKEGMTAYKGIEIQTTYVQN
jgi:hypothetical protein